MKPKKPINRPDLEKLARERARHPVESVDFDGSVAAPRPRELDEQPAAVFENVSVVTYTVRLVVPDRKVGDAYPALCSAAAELSRKLGGAWQVDLGTCSRFLVE